MQRDLPAKHGLTLGDVAFWRRAVPALSIQPEYAAARTASAFRLDEAESRRIAADLVQEGYFATSPFLPAVQVGALAEAVSTLFDQGLPPVFVCMYDEFWQFLQGLETTFESVLGPQYRVRADFWVWRIRRGAQYRGWKAHRDAPFIDKLGPDDFIRADGSARMCTLWIALTDTSVDNSCMYVLPRSLDPQFKAFMSGLELPWIEALKSRVDMNRALPLPVPAGAVLGWVPYLLHWGGPSSAEARVPRISIGIYCAAADLADEQHLSPGEPLRDFELRRRVVADLIEKYRRSGHMDIARELGDSVVEFAQRWSA